MFSSELVSALPDDRPITSICVVETVAGCPPGHTVVSRTHDQDTDADLWKDNFWRRETRYLCISKADNVVTAARVVEDLAIIGERDMPPEGHSLIPHTVDTGNRAWKRRQVVYKLSAIEMALRCVVDVIILSKFRQTPDGFALIGELNGLTVCCKYGKNVRTPKRAAPAPPLPYTPSPGHEQRTSNGPAASTLAQAYAGIDGVPFIINPGLQKSKDLKHFSLAEDSSMTLETLESLTSYDFSTEYTVLQQAS